MNLGFRGVGVQLFSLLREPEVLSQAIARLLKLNL